MDDDAYLLTDDMQAVNNADFQYVSHEGAYNKASFYATESTNIKGGAKPFFDRFIDDNPDDRSDEGYQDFLPEPLVKASIIEEVEHILNTRCNVPYARYQEMEDNAVYFGLPAFYGIKDAQSFNALNTLDRLNIERTCARAIAIFEPRLRDVTVQIANYDAKEQRLTISVHAKMVLYTGLKALSFTSGIDQSNQGVIHLKA